MWERERKKNIIISTTTYHNNHILYVMVIHIYTFIYNLTNKLVLRSQNIERKRITFCSDATCIEI